jgi:hypothetical protein
MIIKCLYILHELIINNNYNFLQKSLRIYNALLQLLLIHL